MIPEQTIENMLRLCAQLREKMAVCESTMEVFLNRPDIVAETIEIMTELGLLTVAVDGVTDARVYDYFKATGNMLQLADAGIAYIFCMYDIDGFESTCMDLLSGTTRKQGD